MTRRRGARGELRRGCAHAIARLVGGLWGCLVCCSLSGGSLLLHPSPLPLKDNVVFPLCFDVAVGQVGGHKRKYAAMMQSSSRAGVKVSMLSLLLGALFLSLGNWCFSISIFAGWPRWGASRPDVKKDSLKFRGGRAFPRSSLSVNVPCARLSPD